MDFIEIAVRGIDGEAAEAVSELFNRYGYGGAVIEDEEESRNQRGARCGGATQKEPSRHQHQRDRRNQ